MLCVCIYIQLTIICTYITYSWSKRNQPDAFAHCRLRLVSVFIWDVPVPFPQISTTEFSNLIWNYQQRYDNPAIDPILHINSGQKQQFKENIFQCLD